MDGKGRAIDNIFVERLWRSLKYEEVYLKDYETVQEAKEQGAFNWVEPNLISSFFCLDNRQYLRMLYQEIWNMRFVPERTQGNT